MNRALIDNIWLLRNRGDNIEAHAKYLQLSLELGVTAQMGLEQRYSQYLSSGLQTSDVLDLLIFEASWKRSQRDVASANRLLEDIYKLIQSQSIGPHFQWHFQFALNQFFSANYPSAMDHFFQARYLARNQCDRLSCSLNYILCLENLNYPFIEHLNEFEQEFKNHSTEPWALPLQAQLSALKIRIAFSTATLSDIPIEPSDIGASFQTLFTLAWISKLAYLDIDLPFDWLKQRIVDSPEGHMSGFRLRTLTGLLIDRDLRETNRLPHQVERLYLWLWEWLTNPSPTNTDRLMLYTKNVASRISGVLTSHDYLLLENSLRWLGVFAGISDTLVLQSIQHVSHVRPEANPLLQYESLLIDYVLATQSQTPVSGDTYLVAKQLPVHGSKEFLLPKLLESLELKYECPAKLATLGGSLRSLQQGHLVQTQPVRVDSMTSHISLLRSGRPDSLQSESVATLLLMAQESSHINVSELLIRCFGIKHRDALVHDPKIANLLSRANRILAPTVRFSRKSDLIHVVGREHIEFINQSRHSNLLRGRAEEVLSFFKPSLRSMQVDQFSEPTMAVTKQWVSRREVQQILETSRSSTLRRLQVWIDSGLAQKKGTGKSIRYRLGQELRRSLQTNPMAHQTGATL